MLQDSTAKGKRRLRHFGNLRVTVWMRAPKGRGSRSRSSLDNREFIPNFGERRRQGEMVSTAFVESTINRLVSRRFVKKKPTQLFQYCYCYLIHFIHSRLLVTLRTSIAVAQRVQRLIFRISMPNSIAHLRAIHNSARVKKNNIENSRLFKYSLYCLSLA